MSRFNFGLARIVIAACLIVPAAARAQMDVNLSVSFAPPPIPVYVQPPIPDDGYIWSPGYWAYDDGDYYWVPGTWVRPPAVGLFWTPGYWAWNDGFYVFNRGYWGPHVGFYGGVNYGYGYTGSGYQGGYWNRGAFYYNRSINNFGDRRITRVYNKTVINNVTVNNVSYNGGAGGIRARPNPREQSYAREHHIAPTQVQIQHLQAAVRDRDQRASVNHGKPPVAATNRPAQFSGAGVVPARAAGGPIPERSRPNGDRPRDDRTGSQQRPQGPAPVELQARPARDNARPVNQPFDRTPEQMRPPQSREIPQREQQPPREQQVQQQQRDQQQREQQMQQRNQQQREQQVQQQREQQQRLQQVQQERQQHTQQIQQQREQQVQRVQQIQQPHEQRQVQPQQQREQPQRQPEGRDRPDRKPQGEPRRDDKGKE